MHIHFDELSPKAIIAIAIFAAVATLTDEGIHGGVAYLQQLRTASTGYYDIGSYDDYSVPDKRPYGSADIYPDKLDYYDTATPNPKQ